MPIENELENLEKNHSEVHVHKRGLKIFAVKNYLRRFVCIVSSDRTETINAFHNVYSSLPGKNGNEPMLNILCFYKIGEWRIIIFPRKRLRPSHFFRPDEKQIVVSPAAVELGGVLVLPVGKDFEVISNDIISEIYDEVTLSLSHFEQWINYFMNAYR